MKTTEAENFKHETKNKKRGKELSIAVNQRKKNGACTIT
jgi:hypothetical protein